MTETTDLMVLGLVVAARLLVPLLIPRYPLPAILAALVIDGVDQTVFQTLTNLNLEGYQGYDKALDIYYLTIAYISTLRNWSNHLAFQASRFLFYWRLVGVALFELTQVRALLLVFPNTFEYFFIFYEAYRLRWDPAKMSQRLVIGAAAGIWIVIKLPQEWWIHIAQLDTTDLIKERVFGVAVDTPWGEILSTNPGPFVAAIALVAALAAIAYGLARRHLPPAGRKPSFAAGAYQPRFGEELAEAARALEARQIFDWALFEKVVMVSLVSIIFAQVLEVSATDVQLAAGIALVVVINTALSHWLVRRRVGWASTSRQFVAMAMVNFSLLLALAGLLRRAGGSVDLATPLFFALLLTLLVVLFDRYRQVYLMRFACGARPCGDVAIATEGTWRERVPARADQEDDFMSQTATQPDPLPSWNEGASKRAILRFVEMVTSEGGAGYVAPVDRIAVFDNDGTLWSERPFYFQLAFALDRVRVLAPEHPEWRDQQPFQAILEDDISGALAGGMRALLDILKATHGGDTTAEFEATVAGWIAEARHPRTGRRYTEMVYQPMLELLEYLRCNEFRTYIVSGGGIEFMRVWAEDVYGIPPEQVIGSSVQTKFEMREDGPVLVRIPEIDFVDDNEGKPVGINRFIGRRPILAFGNSDGDLQMLQWTAAGAGARFMGLVHHTDAEREWAYDRDAVIGKLDGALDEAWARGWTLVDMARDWRAVYPWEESR